MIRPATIADLPALKAILNHLITDTTVTFQPIPKTDTDMAAMLSDAQTDDRPLLVVTDATDTAIGYATYGPFRSGAGYAATAEHSIALHPNATAKGTGRALLKALEQAATARGITTMVAGISADNTTALKFHAAMGYHQTGHMPGVGHKFGRRLDLILMQKAIAAK